MKIKLIAKNMTELHKDNGDIILFSYETPVAAMILTGEYKGLIQTNHKFSLTTTRHINKWFSFDYDFPSTTGYKPFIRKVDQSFLEELIREKGNEPSNKL